MRLHEITLDLMWYIFRSVVFGLGAEKGDCLERNSTLLLSHVLNPLKSFKAYTLDRNHGTIGVTYKRSDV